MISSGKKPPMGFYFNSLGLLFERQLDVFNYGEHVCILENSNNMRSAIERGQKQDKSLVHVVFVIMGRFDSLVFNLFLYN